MDMKKLSILAAIVLIVSLFAGCGGSSANTPTPSASSSGTAAETPTPTAAPTETPVVTAEPSPYKFAAGKYTTGKDGFPTGPYEYELPISTTDETLSFWTTSFTPQYIPEGGYDTIPYINGLKEKTGVNIEYLIFSSEARAENFSVLLASDEIPDICSQPYLYYPGTKRNAIDEGYFTNLYDYKDYCPNYLYNVISHKDDENLYNTVFAPDNMIYAFYSMGTKALVSQGFMTRYDWLTKLGMSQDSIVTFDDVHDMLYAYKSQISTCEFPMEMICVGDYINWFGAYDTYTIIAANALPSPLVIDGKVSIAYAQDNDRDCVPHALFNDIAESPVGRQIVVAPDLIAFRSQPCCDAFSVQLIWPRVGDEYRHPIPLGLGYQCSSRESLAEITFMSAFPPKADMSPDFLFAARGCLIRPRGQTCSLPRTLGTLAEAPRSLAGLHADA
jgi:hypothetical protein